ncbi:tRNA1(Val) (adenine(37)-N6)-methyltransferase [Isobaculum melis]|uniref:tRNA1(Val) A37 N6-methylase TrmN6 n=1 Tax=Isobaculum melis TaxID=142588 RepID=A0A1H9SP98_9LACT|nr:tRNA1(Val) A37 N6-methylase TrmN6 [Isobaculum melis]
MVEIYQDERLDQLIAEKLQIIQSSSVFSFSLDAVLLANFAQIPTRAKTIVDLCTGNGVIPLFLSPKTRGKIIGVELQERLADMAQRSVKLNHLEDKITIIQDDLKQAPTLIGKDKVDIVTCNPPYFTSRPTSQKNPNEHLAIARHEIHTNLEEVIRTTSELLKMNGKAYFVHRPERLVDILTTMASYRLAPKKIRLVYPKMGKDANILLIEGIKDGKQGLKIQAPLYVFDENDDYLPEVRAMLYGKEE